MCTCSGFHHPPGLPLPSKLIWPHPHPPPGLVPPPPHPPQLIPHRFFVVSPVKTGTHSKILEFSLSCALGLHPYHPLHPPTTLSPGATICAHSRTLACLLHTFACIAHLAHLQHTLHTPSAHPCTPFCTPFPGLATHIWPSHQPRTPSATLGNPASAQPGTAPTPDLCGIKSKPSSPHMGHLFHCGLAQPTQPSKDLVWPGHYCQSGTSSHCSKPCCRLTYFSIPWPMGREILLSGQDSDLSSLGAYEGLALRGG